MYLKNFCRLSDRHSRYGRRHVEQRSFVQWRHEFLAQSEKRKNREEEEHQRGQQDEPAETQNKIQSGLVNGNEKSIEWILSFRRDLSSDQKCHQDRREGDGQHRRKKHRERFCECERLEQPALLRGQRKDRQKTHRDHKQ